MQKKQKSKSLNSKKEKVVKQLQNPVSNQNPAPFIPAFLKAESLKMNSTDIAYHLKCFEDTEKSIAERINSASILTGQLDNIKVQKTFVQMIACSSPTVQEFAAKRLAAIAIPSIKKDVLALIEYPDFLNLNKKWTITQLGIHALKGCNLTTKELSHLVIKLCDLNPLNRNPQSIWEQIVLLAKPLSFEKPINLEMLHWVASKGFILRSRFSAITLLQDLGADSSQTLTYILECVSDFIGHTPPETIESLLNFAIEIKPWNIKNYVLLFNLLNSEDKRISNIAQTLTVKLLKKLPMKLFDALSVCLENENLDIQKTSMIALYKITNLSLVFLTPPQKSKLSKVIDKAHVKSTTLFQKKDKNFSSSNALVLGLRVVDEDILKSLEDRSITLSRFKNDIVRSILKRNEPNLADANYLINYFLDTPITNDVNWWKILVNFAIELQNPSGIDYQRILKRIFEIQSSPFFEKQNLLEDICRDSTSFFWANQKQATDDLQESAQLILTKLKCKDTNVSNLALSLCYGATGIPIDEADLINHYLEGLENKKDIFISPFGDDKIYILPIVKTLMSLGFSNCKLIAKKLKDLLIVLYEENDSIEFLNCVQTLLSLPGCFPLKEINSLLKTGNDKNISDEKTKFLREFLYQILICRLFNIFDGKTLTSDSLSLSKEKAIFFKTLVMLISRKELEAVSEQAGKCFEKYFTFQEFMKNKKHIKFLDVLLDLSETNKSKVININGIPGWAFFLQSKINEKLISTAISVKINRVWQSLLLELNIDQFKNNPSIQIRIIEKAFEGVTAFFEYSRSNNSPNLDLCQFKELLEDRFPFNFVVQAIAATNKTSSTRIDLIEEQIFQIWPTMENNDSESTGFFLVLYILLLGEIQIVLTKTVLHENKERLFEASCRLNEILESKGYLSWQMNFYKAQQKHDIKS